MSLTNNLEVVPFKDISLLFTSSKPRISVFIPKDLSISPSVVWGLAIELAKSNTRLTFSCCASLDSNRQQVRASAKGYLIECSVLNTSTLLPVNSNLQILPAYCLE